PLRRWGTRCKIPGNKESCSQLPSMPSKGERPRMSRTTDQAYADLIRQFKDYTLLGSCASVLGWDERTYMPRQGSAHRADQMALRGRLTHEMLTAPEIGQLLSEVERAPLVSEQDSLPAVNVREIRRLYDRAVKLPKELVEELARVTTRAQQVWQEAR